MPCNPEVLKQVPLFALLDDDEVAVLAAQVELKTFATRQRIYKMGEPGDRRYSRHVPRLHGLERDRHVVRCRRRNRGEDAEDQLTRHAHPAP